MIRIFIRMLRIIRSIRVFIRRIRIMLYFRPLLYFQTIKSLYQPVNPVRSLKLWITLLRNL